MRGPPSPRASEQRGGGAGVRMPTCQAGYTSKQRAGHRQDGRVA